MSENVTLNGQKLYEQRKIKLVVFGMFLGILSGITALIQSIINSVIGTLTIGNSGIALPDSPIAILILIVGVLAISDIIGAVWFLLFNLVTGRSLKEQVRTFKLPVAWLMAISAITAGAFGQGMVFAAFAFCGMTVGATIVGGTPLVTTIIARFVFKEKLNVRAIFGIIILIVGAFVSAYGPSSVMPNFFVGVVCALLATLGFSLEGIISTYAADLIDPYIGCMFYRNLIAGLGELALAAILTAVTGFSELLPTILGSVFTPSVFPWFLIMGLLSALSYGTIYGAFPKAGPSRTLAMVFTTPLWTLPVGFAAAAIIPQYYKFAVTTPMVLGAIAVIIGSVLIVMKPSELLNLRDI